MAYQHPKQIAHHRKTVDPLSISLNSGRQTTFTASTVCKHPKENIYIFREREMMMNAVFAADAEIGSDAVFAADSGLGSDAVFATRWICPHS